MHVNINSGVPPQRSNAGDNNAVAPARQPDPEQLSAVQAVLQAVPMAAVAHTVDYRLIAVNQDCAALLQLPPGEIADRPVRDFIPPPDQAKALGLARAVASATGTGTRPSSSLRRLLTGDGQELTCWLHVGIAVIAGYECFIACIDLVNPVLSEAHRWRYRAEHDELTGLRRRGSLLSQVAQWIDGGRTVVFAFLDVDDFKSINDTHGHAAGDHVLSTLGRRLEQYAPPGCLVGRLSGDEFVLADLLAGTTDDPAQEDPAAAALRTVADRCAAEPIPWGDRLLPIALSVGIAVNSHGEDTAALLAKADDAMYRQKSSRRVR
jgi:diguanylate cyclase (GGDEF)-like protein